MLSVEQKPGHLGLKYAEQFKDSSIVAVYHYRHPYPDEAIDQLLALITDEPRIVLDVGCGTGDLCRRLASAVERVDAVDFFSRERSAWNRWVVAMPTPARSWVCVSREASRGTGLSGTCARICCRSGSWVTSRISRCVAVHRLRPADQAAFF